MGLLLIHIQSVANSSNLPYYIGMNSFKYIIIVAASIGALFFIALTISGSAVYYREVGEVVLSSDNFSGVLRISGRVAHSDFILDRFAKSARFTIADKSGNAMPVSYIGSIPSAFEAGADVIIEGSYNREQNLFTASKLIAKCPSKYETALASVKG